MPPKGKKGQDKGKSAEEERDEPLQAVVRSMMRLRSAQC
jgi:translation initiation factor eIF-2B subunit epsilon